VAFSGTVSDPLNVGGIDLRLKFAGDSLRDLYDLTGVLLPETPSFSTDGRLRADFKQKPHALSPIRILTAGSAIATFMAP
jgi:uncharacterized protein involved in outer membrane biogenesis